MSHSFLLIALATAIMANPLQARTWTSSNGVTTFVGEYVSSTKKSLVFLHKGKKETIRLSRLSEADQAWIAKENQRDLAPHKKVSYRSLREQIVGKKLINHTFRAKDGRFVSENIRKVPQYYFLYFAASW